ncbi:ScbA/BarX family gamma-butyrolactone biosynthesis protein [Streptomyces sp. NPDC052077]|uniref:ScbA/BarX family gamma-butyrolactone biosynthesis protein n=1 Tax=Streptomyces sp. NPDC052077 TaxID=3154757 RepID=UPI003447A786
MLTSFEGTGNEAAALGSGPLLATVPRGYVHRASVAEVLLTGWESDTAAAAPGAPERFTVRAQWPRSHALFAPAHGHQDPLLLVETIRQTGSLLSHAEYGLPFGHQFVMWDISFTALPSAFAIGPRPTDVELRAECANVVRRGRTLAGMRYGVTVLRDGLPVATGGARFSCASPAAHRRLRGGRPTTVAQRPPVPVGAARVGHTDPDNVLLAATPRENLWTLRVDTDHPVFFDHPVDHVPGMMLIEAARQAARAAVGRPDALLVDLRSEFTRYAELDAPCLIEARVLRPETPRELRVDVWGTQEGERVFTAELRLAHG